MSDDVRQQIQALHEALTDAKQQILAQQVALEQLTAPPFGIGTVIGLSSIAPPRGAPTVLKHYKDGDAIKVAADKLSDGEYRAGDKLVVVSRDGLGEWLARASTFEIIGWSTKDPKEAVIRADDKGVTVKTDRIARWFKISERGQDNTPRDTVILAVEGKVVEVLRPDFPIAVGDAVRVLAGAQIIAPATMTVGVTIAVLRRVIDETFSEVEGEASVRVVFNGKYARDSLAAGDRVVLDPGALVIVNNFGKDEERFRFDSETNVCWEDIGGCVVAKATMVEVIELPYRNPGIYQHYGKKPVKGVLLYGPPGCGKTMLGKAAATALASISPDGKRTGSGFLYVKGPEILERWVGVAEATIRSLFMRARVHKEAYGFPAVIFIDEADAILGKRGMGISSDIERTIVPMFLAEMDGLADAGALVILATNRSDILDPAVTRDGRIDRKIKIERPGPVEAGEIFRLYLKGVPLEKGCDRDQLAITGAQELFSPKRTLYQIDAEEKTHRFNLAHVINGGMIAGVVDKATSTAMRRDLARSRPGGLTRQDIIGAVDLTEAENRDLNHHDDIADFILPFKDTVKGVRKLQGSVAA